MPELLGPTNPVPGYETTVNRQVIVTPNEQQNVQNVVDPSRIGRTDSRADRNNTQDAASSLRLRYDSNFLTFVQRMRNTPQLRETLGTMLMREGTSAVSGMREGIAGEMSEIMRMLKMDEAELRQFLLTQMKSATRFGGALFSLLREAFQSGQSELLQNDILQFLRKFSDFSSTGHIEENLLRNLNAMAKAMPSKWANPLSEMIAELQNGIAAGDRAGNLSLLRGGIFGLMSGFVGQTHDLGTARGLLSKLTLDLVRYENGAPADMLAAFRQLGEYGIFGEGFSELSDEQLMRILRETDFHRAAGQNAFADQLIALAERALRGEGGRELQESFRNILNAVLLNESVYMPVNHLMIPLEWEGRMMFSELWVDPDAETETKDGKKKGVRMLIKMDIQDVGLFDVLINTQGDEVLMHVACPERVAAFSDQLTRGLTDILTANGLRAEHVQVQQMKQPLGISEVFPKIFERKNSINVKI